VKVVGSRRIREEFARFGLCEITSCEVTCLNRTMRGETVNRGAGYVRAGFLLLEENWQSI
jgi:hypothetical protein